MQCPSPKHGQLTDGDAETSVDSQARAYIEPGRFSTVSTQTHAHTLKDKSNLLLLKFRVTSCTKMDGQRHTHSFATPTQLRASELMNSNLLTRT